MPSMPLSLRNFALCIARLQFSALLINLLVPLAVFVFPQITQGQTLKADYQFQNTRSSFIGNSTLTDTGFNTFQTDTVDGNSRSVLRFPFNNGLQLSAATNLIPSNNYTIVMLFKLDSVSGFIRLIDFKNRTTDNGLYILNGQLELCQTCSTIPANTYVQIVFTRSSSGIFAGYVNGVPQGQGPDANNDFVIDASNILKILPSRTADRTAFRFCSVPVREVLGVRTISVLDLPPSTSRSATLTVMEIQI